MKTEAQRIAIAEACGWTPHSVKQVLSMWFRPNEKHRLLERTTNIPDYLNDLNAMYEAEGWLIEQMKWGDYLRALKLVTNSDDDHVNCVRATAAQRAEAFLKTIGKWVVE